MTIYQPAEDSFLMKEVLEKEVPPLLKRNPHLKFFEIGSGSGINLTTAKDLGVKYIQACDTDLDSMKYCRLKLGFDCVKQDLFGEDFPTHYDLIIFNPPYLPEDPKEPEESKLATTGGKKGSEVVNRFLTEAKNHLTSKGRILLLTSSLTEGIEWNGWNKKEIGKKKLFMEQLSVWELTL
jgi:release factor glutamine methyltransferase